MAEDKPITSAVAGVLRRLAADDTQYSPFRPGNVSVTREKVNGSAFNIVVGDYTYTVYVTGKRTDDA